MRRAVITGLGIVSSIGNNQEEVLESLRQGKSGISRSESFAEMGLRCQVWGPVKLDPKDHIDRKALRLWVTQPLMPILRCLRQLQTQG